MADISKLNSAVIEKQELILNSLPNLSYQEVMKLMASLSSLIINLERAQAEVEIQCNKILVSELESDPKATFSKAEVSLKSKEIYLSYKNILSLKQCTLRGFTLARLHAQYLLKIKTNNDEAEASDE